MSTKHFIRHYLEMVVAMFLGVALRWHPGRLGARRGRNELMNMSYLAWAAATGAAGCGRCAAAAPAVD